MALTSSRIEQDPFKNLPAQAVTRVVGGMATHCTYLELHSNQSQCTRLYLMLAWFLYIGTCAVPRFNEKELPVLNPDPTANQKEWYGDAGEPGLYDKAEALIKKGDTQFDRSIRHNLVLDTLQKSPNYSSRTFQQIPLACTRKSETVVEWSSAHTVFDLANRPNPQFPEERFQLFPATQCEKLVLKAGSQNEIEYAVCRNFQDGNSYQVRAKVFILSAGAIHNPQVS